VSGLNAMRWVQNRTNTEGWAEGLTAVSEIVWGLCLGNGAYSTPKIIAVEAKEKTGKHTLTHTHHSSSHPVVELQ
jgi:hypothetical protein